MKKHKDEVQRRSLKKKHKDEVRRSSRKRF